MIQIVELCELIEELFSLKGKNNTGNDGDIWHYSKKSLPL